MFSFMQHEVTASNNGPSKADTHALKGPDK
jgi:hypothetical protein